MVSIWNPFPNELTPDTDKTFEMGITIHDGDKKKDFFKSIKTLYKVQDLHEEFLMLQKTLQAFFWVELLWVCVCMYVCIPIVLFLRASPLHQCSVCVSALEILNEVHQCVYRKSTGRWQLRP